MGVAMDPVWMHLLVNHIPIIVTAFALLMVIGAVIIKNDMIKRIGLILYVTSGLTVYAANFTGEPAEEKLEQIAGISHKQIHEHEEAAELMVTLMSIGLVLALLHLFGKPANPKLQQIILVGFLIVGALASFQGVRTGHEGGLIRRPELGGAPATNVPPPSTTPSHQ